MRKPAMNPVHAGARGFTLLEVLIALFVLSLGLIGLAMLQTVGLKYNTNSQSRTQSTLMAYDIIDRMRANPDAVVAGNYDVADNAAAIAASSGYTNCGSTQCSKSQMAKYDLGKWYEMQNSLLPGATLGDRSTITRDDLTAPKTVTITLRWTEDDLPKEQIWEVEL